LSHVHATWLFALHDTDSPNDSKERVMLATRRREDSAPELTPIPGLTIRPETDAAVMARLQGRTVGEMIDRFAAGHRAYVACMAGEPAAFGWVATRVATIGELATTFEIPRGERYLWNFVTLPAHRGKGIYPRLVDAIVHAESRDAHRFWIAYAPENHASGSGIRKAGFVTVAELSFDAAGRPAVAGRVAEGGVTAASVLGLPLATETLTRCWRCARAAARGEVARAGMSCVAGRCACDYQRPEIVCAA
jgi:GNAT superfamily N-acetyltransferase